MRFVCSVADWLAGRRDGYLVCFFTCRHTSYIVNGIAQKQSKNDKRNATTIQSHEDQDNKHATNSSNYWAFYSVRPSIFTMDMYELFNVQFLHCLVPTIVYKCSFLLDSFHMTVLWMVSCHVLSSQFRLRHVFVRESKWVLWCALLTTLAVHIVFSHWLKMLIYCW